MKIKVGFIVIYPNAFPAKPIVDRMVVDGRFDVKIIIAPDVARGEINMRAVARQAYEYYSSNYKNVVSGIDLDSGEIYDCCAGLDFACICNPYESMTHKFFNAAHLDYYGAKVFYIHYSYSVTKWDRNSFRSVHFGKYWKIFWSSEVVKSEMEADGVDVTRFKVVGYPKMDDLPSKKTVNHDCKTIILAPHHTIGNWSGGLNIGCFSKFQDLYKIIPREYPDILFIFRPHPMFLNSLQKTLSWSSEQVMEYLNDILSAGNVIYDTDPEYLNSFRDSDGLIHDCGSFIAEYMYTGNPCCYLVRNEDTRAEFNQLGKYCYDGHYHALDLDDVRGFVNDVIVGELDVLKEYRLKLGAEIVMINHPNASESIIKEILESSKGAWRIKN